MFFLVESKSQTTPTEKIKRLGEIHNMNVSFPELLYNRHPLDFINHMIFEEENFSCKRIKLSSKKEKNEIDIWIYEFENEQCAVHLFKYLNNLCASSEMKKNILTKSFSGYNKTNEYLILTSRNFFDKKSKTLYNDIISVTDSQGGCWD